MKKLNILILVTIISFISCDPLVEDKEPLGEPPTDVSFTIDDLGENTFRFTNTTPGTFIHQWDYEIGSAEGNTITVQFATAGVYTVTLRAFTDGGFGESSQQVEVSGNVSLGCSDPIFDQLTDCGNRVWKLDDGDGTFFVGPNPDETWWASSTADNEERFCAWDDEWIFSEDAAMVYDTKGDIWGEDYLGFNFECVDENLLADNLKPWGSGNHTFFLEPGDPYRLTTIGLGAFIGLPKASNGAEVTTPQSSNTYDIIDISDVGNKKVMLLEINMGAGIWRFRLKSEI